MQIHKTTKLKIKSNDVESRFLRNNNSYDRKLTFLSLFVVFMFHELGKMNVRKNALLSATNNTFGDMCCAIVVINMPPESYAMIGISVRIKISHISITPSYKAIKNIEIRVELHSALVIIESRRRQNTGFVGLLSLQIAKICQPIDKIASIYILFLMIFNTAPL